MIFYLSGTGNTKWAAEYIRCFLPYNLIAGIRGFVVTLLIITFTDNNTDRIVCKSSVSYSYILY